VAHEVRILARDFVNGAARTRMVTVPAHLRNGPSAAENVAPHLADLMAIGPGGDRDFVDVVGRKLLTNRGNCQGVE
jgi:hypothetical protein